MTERHHSWPLEAMRSDEYTEMVAASDSRRQQEGNIMSTGNSGFTAINNSNHSLQANLPLLHANFAGTVEPQNSNFNSHVTTNQLVDQYLGLGEDNISESLFVCRATTIATREMSPESDDVYPYSLRNKPSKKITQTDPLKPQRKCKAKVKKSISDAWKVTKSGASVTSSRAKEPQSKLRAEPPYANEQQSERTLELFAHSQPANSSRSKKQVPQEFANNPSPVVSAKTFTLPEETIQRLNAWKFQSPNPSNLSLSSSIPAASFITKSNSHMSTSNESDDPTQMADAGYAVKSIISTPSRNTMLTQDSDINPQPVSAQVFASQPRNHFLDTIYEEIFSSQDILTDKHQLNQPEPIDREVNPANNGHKHSCHGTANQPVEFTDDVYQNDQFDGLEDDDFLDLDVHLNSSDTMQPQRMRGYLASSFSTGGAATLPTPQPSNALSSSPAFRAANGFVGSTGSQDEWIILGDNDEVDLLDLPDNILENITFPPPTSSITLSSPIKLQTEPLQVSAPEVTSMDHAEDCLHSILHPPIVRSAFPSPIRDRSPLIGVSASTYLRTCFRIGEALNTGCKAARNEAKGTSSSILIELYAKVVSSTRDDSGIRQHFVFSDLFHEVRPPFINGTYECWKGCELWEYDCGRLLTSGEEYGDKKLCRAVGKMKREGKEWRFNVLNIWEATWDDIEYVRGIVCYD